MRTLTEKVRSVFGSERRRYSVEGTIMFVFNSPLKNPDLTTFRQAIEEVDRCFPWLDDDLPKGFGLNHIRLNEGRVVLEGNGSEQKILFSIHPYSLRSGQLYAFERYLAKLAEKLMKPKPWEYWPTEVRSEITIRATTRFYFPYEKFFIQENLY